MIRARAVLRWLTLLAVGAVLASGLLLARYYVPGPFEGFPPDDRQGLSRTLVRVHEASMLVAIVVALVRTVLLAADRAPRRAIAGAALVVGGMVVAWATWPFVRWDQIGLVAVTVGTGLRGLWWPAFEDEVRFLLIGGAEVSPTTYGCLLPGRSDPRPACDPRLVASTATNCGD